MRSSLFFVFLLVAPPAAAAIQGSSTVSNCGEGGNWIDLTFTTDAGVQLVDAWWDFNPTIVWLDADGSSICAPQNNGVTSYSFYFDGPVGEDTQDFGLTASGFDGGDYFRFVMDLDRGTAGSPFTTDYYGALLTVEFSDGTILNGVFDTPYDEPNGATATFTNAGSLPNLTFEIKPGWADVLVPRDADDATWTNVPAPTALVGESDATWLNAVCRNIGATTAMPTRMTIHLDGVHFLDRNLWTIDPGSWNGPINAGPYNIRGGRHTIRVTADALDAVNESNEDDNVFAEQFTWQAVELAPLATLTRAAPPLASADTELVPGYWYNCDGVRITPSAAFEWCAVWVERVANDRQRNYRLRLHPASDDPYDAFGSNLEITPDDVGLQALLINTRTVGGASRDVGVLNHHGRTDDYRIAHLHESPYPFDFGIEPETPYFASRLMMFEFQVGTGDLGPATLTAYSDPEDGPVRMGWLGPDFTYGHQDDLLDLVTTDVIGCAKINLDLTETGYYCAVFYGHRAEHPDGLAVNVGLYGPRPDLAPVTPPGWHAPVVPRPATDATEFSCPLPDTLHGNAQATWMNFAFANEGTVDAAPLRSKVHVDGMIRNTYYTSAPPLAPGLSKISLNMNELLPGGQFVPWFIRGGRHTVSYELDYLDELAESVERNNLSGRQYCWSPHEVPHGAVVVFEAPPPPTGGWAQCDTDETLYPNCDGLRLLSSVEGEERRHRAMAAMASQVQADVDLQLHQPLQGVHDGFGADPIVVSAEPAGLIDIVLINDNVAPRLPYDVGVIDDGIPDNGAYIAQAAASVWRGSNPTGHHGPYAVAGGTILDLHEYQLPAGPLVISLHDMDTNVDWGLSLYDTRAFHNRADVLGDGIAWEAGAGQTETIFVDVPVADRYCLAVWKTGPGEVLKMGTYELWFAPGASAVDDPASDLPTASAFVGAVPNPFNPQTTITFNVVKSGRCELSLHDVQGRAVRTLVTADLTPGRHETIWDGLDERGHRVASGVYVARLKAADRIDLLKVTLVK